MKLNPIKQNYEANNPNFGKLKRVICKSGYDFFGFPESMCESNIMYRLISYSKNSDFFQKNNVKAFIEAPDKKFAKVTFKYKPVYTGFINKIKNLFNPSRSFEISQVTQPHRYLGIPESASDILQRQWFIDSPSHCFEELAKKISINL